LFVCLFVNKKSQNADGSTARTTVKSGFCETTSAMLGRLAGRVVVVTGGAAGIGGGCSIAAAREGAKVVVADIDIDNGKMFAKELGATFIQYALKFLLSPIPNVVLSCVLAPPPGYDGQFICSVAAESCRAASCFGIAPWLMVPESLV
jgi:hypothetical protein